jgi:hypothetical protein
MRFLLFFFLAALVFAEDRVFIESGSSSYEIVTAADANPATMLAVRELRTWIKQSTGVAAHSRDLPRWQEQGRHA